MSFVKYKVELTSDSQTRQKHSGSFELNYVSKLRAEAREAVEYWKVLQNIHLLIINCLLYQHVQEVSTTPTAKLAGGKFMKEFCLFFLYKSHSLSIDKADLSPIKRLNARPLKDIQTQSSIYS